MNIVVLIEAFASIAYITGAYVCYRMFRETFHVTSVWLHLFVAMVCFMVASISNVFEWLHIAETHFETVEEVLKCVGSYALFTTTFTYHRESRLHKDVVRQY